MKNTLKKKLLLLLTTVFLIAGVSTGAYFMWEYLSRPYIGHQEEGLASLSVDDQELRKNFYQAVNKDWLDRRTLDGTTPAVNAFYELSLNLNTDLYQDILRLKAGQERSDIKGMDQAVDYMQVVFDFSKREKDGVEPAKQFLKLSQDIDDFKELTDHLDQRVLNGEDIPFYVGVGVDPQDTSRRMIVMTSPETFLPDQSYYQDPATKQQALEVFKESRVKILQQYGYSESDASRLVDEAIQFDQLIAENSLTAAEANSSAVTTQLVDLKWLSDHVKNVDLKKLVQDLTEKDPKQVNLMNKKYYEHFDEIINEKNFPIIKSWMIVHNASSMTKYLDEESRQNGEELNNFLQGTKTTNSPQEAAYGLVLKQMAEPISVYYGQKYFGEDSKKEVTQMIEGVVAAYEKRLQNNDFLSEQTKEKAIQKLQHLRYYVGYPEKVSETFLATSKVDPNKSLVENDIALLRAKQRYDFEHFEEPVDKDEWSIPSFEVNAVYNPANNSMNISAAILQAPFYSKDQSTAENYGAIGAVIGHEITHAFDDNGALYDQDGNMKNWWTEEDRAAFKERTKAMVDQWNTLTFEGEQVNGELTVAENTADAGGLAAALDAYRDLEKRPDLKTFFESWARMWRMKATKAYNRLLLSSDPHAPNELRTNRQLMNLDAFYEVFGIKEGDGMYLSPEERIRIW